MGIDSAIDHLIDLAIAEDIGKGDVTTQALLPSTAEIAGKFLLKQAGIVAGLPFLKAIFLKIDPRIEVSLLVEEGSFQKAGTFLATISGPAQGILSGEKVALNLIQHASGVASVISAFVRKISGCQCAILDTRKTLPGLRALEKYAVKIGGGVNHRFRLDDRFIIKKNHLSFLDRNSLTYAIAKIKGKGLPIEVEIEDIQHLHEALQEDTVDTIMLSKMPPEDVKKCVEQIHARGKKAYFESSAITLDTVRAYAETGVDGVSIGALILSVPALDMGLRLFEQDKIEIRKKEKKHVINA